MYDVTNTVKIIKDTAKEKGISTTKMLEDIGLNKNTLSSMGNRGSWISSDGLAKIADYLDVSVDYLLGRTEEDIRREIRDKLINGTPDENVRNAVIGKINTMSDEQCRKLLDLLEALARG